MKLSFAIENDRTIFRFTAVACAFLTLVLLGGCAGTRTKLLEEGKAFAAAEDWDKTVRALQEAYRKDPQSTEIRLMLQKAKWNASLMHMQRGEALLEKDLYNDAVAEFQMSVALNPTNQKAAALIQKANHLRRAEHYVKRARNLLQAEKFVQAREELKKALQLAPDHKEAQKLLAYYEKKEAPPRFRLKLKSEEPISLKFKDTPILNVFEVLSRLTGINFIFDKEMPESKVTLFMTDVSFDRFLDVLLQTNKLDAQVVDHNTMVIFPATPAKAAEYAELQIRTFYLANLEPKEAMGILSKILGLKDIIINEKINAVIVRGTQDVIDIASRLLEANDRMPPEMMLNVEVLEVSRTKEKQLGLEFSPSVTAGFGASSPTINPQSKLSDWASLHALERVSSEEFLLSLPTATLNLLRQDQDTQTLANPQIRVKNAHQASILIGERVPLRVNRRVDTNGNVTFDFQYYDVGIKLEAEPLINMHDEVTLNLNVEVSNVGPNRGTTEDPQFSIVTRSARSVITVMDGESVIIGGLINKDDRKRFRTLPGFGQVPILKRLFSNESKDNKHTDIMITITPMVIRSQEIPSREVLEIWSGQEKHFEKGKPYESHLEQKEKYGDRPGKDYFSDREDLPEPPPVPPVEVHPFKLEPREGDPLDSGSGLDDGKPLGG